MFLCENGGKVLPNLVRGMLSIGGAFCCKHLELLVGEYDYHGQVDVLVVI